jgi:cAMP-dependent protein kinase regulator
MNDSISKIQDREKQITQQAHAKSKAKDRHTVFAKPLDFKKDFIAPVYAKEDSEIAFLDGVLIQNFIFGDLSDDERGKLIDAFQKHNAEKGDVIIKQGDVGDYFYIVQSGTVTFFADKKNVGSCGTGAGFGELALLYDGPRAATCKASSSTAVLWKVDQETFRYLLATQAKGQAQDAKNILAKIPLLKNLDRQTQTKFVDCLTTVKYTQGERIVNKGDVGDIFYIVNEGQVKVHDIGMGDSKFVDQIYKQGDWFGERALITGEPRAANCTAVTDVVCFAVDRDTFESRIGSLEIILGHGSKKQFLKSVPIFANSNLLEIEIDQLVDKLLTKKYKKGETLSEKKSAEKDLWIIKEGKLKVTDKGGTTFNLQSGDYFGDNDKAVRVSTHTCVCEEATSCYILTSKDIASVIGTIKRLGAAIAFKPSRWNKDVQLKDLTQHRMLGMGELSWLTLLTIAFQLSLLFPFLLLVALALFVSHSIPNNVGSLLQVHLEGYGWRV